MILMHISLPSVPGDGHRQDFREIARAQNAILVEDFLAGVVPGHSYDGLHPDEQGQAMLAERLVPVLRPPWAARDPVDPAGDPPLFPGGRSDLWPWDDDSRPFFPGARPAATQPPPRRTARRALRLRRPRP